MIKVVAIGATTIPAESAVTFTNTTIQQGSLSLSPANRINLAPGRYLITSGISTSTPNALVGLYYGSAAADYMDIQSIGGMATMTVEAGGSFIQLYNFTKTPIILDPGPSSIAAPDPISAFITVSQVP